MLKISAILVTTSMLFGVVTASVAEEAKFGAQAGDQSVNQSMATGYSTLPEVSEHEEHAHEEHGGDEFFTDNNEFYKRGFMDFDWQTHTQYVQQVLSDVVIPDYVKRTGKQRPKNPSIDVAAGMITNPYFNDLIVQSRLPGDCKADGCLVQIYSLVGEVWIKKFQTTTFAMMAKPGAKLGTVLIGLVGSEEIPSRTVTWTGSVFQENK